MSYIILRIMQKKRVVITGLGLISSVGIGKDAFKQALFKGVSGIKPITLFDTADFKNKTAGEITDFQANIFLGDKGLRILDRSTKLVNSAAKLVLEDANYVVTEDNSRDTGVVIGTNLGSLKSISDYDREAMVEGSRYVNPALFPNTVINSAASQISIRFDIKGFNVTVSAGFTSGLESLNYAANAIRLGRVKAVLAGAVEELCIQTFIGFLKAGCLAGTDSGSIELSCPFDKRRNGVILGEGACVLMLEDLESAQKRKCSHIYAEVKGSQSTFRQGFSSAMIQAVSKSGIKPEEVDYICSGANSSQSADRLEAESIHQAFGDSAKKIAVSSIKSMIGECFSAGGTFAAAAGALSIEGQVVQPLINYKIHDPECDLNFVTNQAQARKVNNVLINSFGPFGENSSLVISKFQEDSNARC